MTDEVERHRCEIRYILSEFAKRNCGTDRVNEYMKKIAEARGQVVADIMRNEARDQWAKGNRGAKGDWRE